MNRTVFSLAALAIFGTLAAAPVVAQVTASPNSINFQGRLTTPSGNPIADGTYTLRLRLYQTATDETYVYQQTRNNVPVKNGVFAVILDGFSTGTFDRNLYLGVKIDTNAELTPRTQIVSVPYALKSQLAVTVPDGSITNAKIAAGTLTADRFASGVLNSNVWLLGGNSGVTSGFLGTTDNQPLEFRVNGRRAMRFVGTDNGDYRGANVLGGSEVNFIAAGVAGATIAGGGQKGLGNRSDLPNVITGNFGTIGGGINNSMSGQYATISGGSENVAEAQHAVVGGGVHNQAKSLFAVIGGGYFNEVTGNFATVAGGYFNVASGQYATVGGGVFNTAAGNASFAAGSNAYANHGGAFVWADSGSETFGSTAANQFLIRASGGVGINTTNPNGFALNVNGTANVNGSLSVATNLTATGAITGNNITAITVTATDALVGARANIGGNVTADKGLFANSVGIGTASPTQKLDVRGSAFIQDSIRQGLTDSLIIGKDYDPFISGAKVGTGGRWGLFQEPYTLFLGMAGSDYIHAGRITLGGWKADSTREDHLTVTNTGNVGIGTTSPDYKLHVNGSVAGVGNYNNLSDARYKTHVQTFPNALDAILGLRGVTFDWKQSDFPDMNFSPGNQVGFIAQEVEKILPQLVTTDANGYKSVAYANVVPVLVEAVKTQHKQIQTLRAELDALKAAVAELKNNK